MTGNTFTLDGDSTEWQELDSMKNGRAYQACVEVDVCFGRRSKGKCAIGRETGPPDSGENKMFKVKLQCKKQSKNFRLKIILILKLAKWVDQTISKI